MPDEKKSDLRIIDVSVTDISTIGSSGTMTTTFGGNIWKASARAVERMPDDNPIYPLIGQIASDWSYVEHTLDTVIWELATIEPENGACITAQVMGAYNRFKAIIALLRVHERRTNKDLSRLITKATELSQNANEPGEKRNRAIHDPWYKYTGTEATGQFKAMAHKDHRYGIHPVDSDHLRTTLKDIEAYSARVKKFRDDVLAAVKA